MRHPQAHNSRTTASAAGPTESGSGSCELERERWKRRRRALPDVAIQSTTWVAVTSPPHCATSDSTSWGSESNQGTTRRDETTCTGLREPTDVSRQNEKSQHPLHYVIAAHRLQHTQTSPICCLIIRLYHTIPSPHPITTIPTCTYHVRGRTQGSSARRQKPLLEHRYGTWGEAALTPPHWGR